MTSSIENALRELRAERDLLKESLRDTERAVEALEKITRTPSSDSQPLKSVADDSPRAMGGAALVLRAFTEVQDKMDTERILREVIERGWETSSDNPRNVIASTIAKLVRQEKLHKVSAREYALTTADEGDV